MNKKYTVTIGVPAYNEECNIKRLLGSIVKQKESGYVIKSIIVASDGSQDGTVKEAQTVKDKRVKIIDDKVNRGRIYRLNQFMRSARADVLVFLDADEELVDRSSLAKLIDEFRADKEVALVSGNPYFEDDGGFVRRCHKASHELYTNFRYKINDGHNVYGCSGGMLALRRDFYTDLQIPEDIYADDTYMYMTCVNRGFKFRNAKEATIAHYVFTTLATHIRRNKRYASTKNDLRKYFGEKLDEEYKLPKGLFLKEAIKLFFKKPVYVAGIFLINKYSILRSDYTKKKRKYAY